MVSCQNGIWLWLPGAQLGSILTQSSLQPGHGVATGNWPGAAVTVCSRQGAASEGQAQIQKAVAGRASETVNNHSSDSQSRAPGTVHLLAPGLNRLKQQATGPPFAPQPSICGSFPLLSRFSGDPLDSGDLRYPLDRQFGNSLSCGG